MSFPRCAHTKTSYAEVCTFHETWEPASWSTLIYMSLPRATSSALASDPVPSSSGSPLNGADADDDGGWSDGSLDESEDSHLEDGSEPEPEWSSHLPTVAELLGHDSLEALHQNGGRPIQHPIDLDRLIELSYDGWSNRAMAEELGVPLQVVEKRKRLLGLTWLAEQPWLPDATRLQEWWVLNPGMRIGALAAALSVSVTTLRRHMRSCGE